MWIVKSAQERLYTVFKNPTTKGITMKTKKLEKVAVVLSEAKGVGAAIAKLMRRRSVIDIVERFQTKHALQEEREMGSAVAVPGSAGPVRARPSLIQLTK
jgi:type III secretory pathway component EscU